jgi:hypothetical protein
MFVPQVLIFKLTTRHTMKVLVLLVLTAALLQPTMAARGLTAHVSTRELQLLMVCACHVQPGSLGTPWHCIHMSVYSTPYYTSTVVTI